MLEGSKNFFRSSWKTLRLPLSDRLRGTPCGSSESKEGKLIYKFNFAPNLILPSSGEAGGKGKGGGMCIFSCISLEGSWAYPPILSVRVGFLQGVQEFRGVSTQLPKQGQKKLTLLLPSLI